ncbi:MAG TPA: hypothetical protein VM029_10660 [Opitutaceae bacterium]|nr:hypothetical protein [Opitutaceae bacterium]
MSAKHGRKNAGKANPTPAPQPVTPAMATSTAAAGTMGDVPTTSSEAWIDSTDPRRRMIGKVVLAGVWIYVAALWLLALDQTFNWGIFGPKVPPIP